MRTMDEIVARINEVKERDWLGTEVGDMLPYLDFEHARPYLKADTKAEAWDVPERGATSPLDEIRDYMPFAFEKATGHRGISASRSISHMRAWSWLAGDDAALAICDDESLYPNYGMPILLRLCEHFGIPVPEPGFDHMKYPGARCRPGCDEGCGK